MKKVIYVVYGSEDGLLGCFGNIKAAYNCANDYVEGGELSYSKVCSELKDTINYAVDVNEWGSEINSSIVACLLNERL